jgi:AcrR family transcriptional regulator
MPQPAAMDIEQQSQPSTDRYTRKKEAIVASATGILNRRGVKGMTLADVAASVDLITTSVTYYFRKKEDLAVACFLSSIERFDALITGALSPGDPHDRLMVFLTRYLDLDQRIRQGEEAPLAIFSDIRALKDPHFTTVLAAYRVMFRKVRELFSGPGLEWMDRKTATARTYMLLEQLYWTVTWLPRYDADDYPRLRDRMFDILSNGLVANGVEWKPAPLAHLEAIQAGALETARETFLVAATRLINQRGYRGASVEKISAQLNVTKGSFYHHNDAKDDLVVECFERTFEVMRRAQRLALEGDGNFWDRLSSAVASLVEYQLSERGPLLRVSALTALPEPIRLDMVERFNRVSERFAGMIADGIAEGSLHAVDPFIAAQLLNATLNGAADLELYLPRVDRHECAELYARPVLMGMFSR